MNALDRLRNSVASRFIRLGIRVAPEERARNEGSDGQSNGQSNGQKKPEPEGNGTVTDRELENAVEFFLSSRRQRIRQAIARAVDPYHD